MPKFHKPEDEQETEEQFDPASFQAEVEAQAPLPESPVGDPPDYVEATRLEVPGTIVDEFTGKVWTLPTGQFDESVLYRSPRDIKKDPRFHYSAYRIDEVPDMESQGFVKVTRKEIGLSEHQRLPGEPVSPLDSYYVIEGDQVMMKIPTQIADARYAAQKKFADAAVAATEPPAPNTTRGPEARAGGRDGDMSRETQKSFDKEGYRI